MSIVPALDLRPAPANQPPQQLPSNIEAEQALIGTVLYDNSAVERAEAVRPDHFYEPLHGEMWAEMAARLSRGVMVEPITLADAFRDHPAFVDLGGLRYLADLVDRAPPASNAGFYASAIAEAALRRQLMAYGAELIELARTPAVPAAQALEEAEKGLFAIAEVREEKGGFVGFDTALDGAVAMAEAAYERDGALAGMSTGLVDLDAKLGGLTPTNLIILAGRPSMGKTALATNIAYNAAKRYAFVREPDGTRRTTDGGIVAFFSLEMSKEELALRIAADRLGIPSDKFRRGLVQPFEYQLLREARDELRQLPLHIDETGGISLARLTARARRLKRKLGGLDLIVIDYLQLITGGSGRSTDNRTQEISNITMGLKTMAKDLGVPVLALSQLSREVEKRPDKRPQLSDLRESGSIEQDADIVAFVYRESYYLGRSEPDTTDSVKHLEWTEKMSQVQGMAEVIIGKARHGPIGTVKLAFNEDLTRFGNLAREGRFPINFRDPSGGS